MIYFLIGILVCIGIPYIFSLVLAPFYFKFGFCKRFFHDIMGWHVPDKGEASAFDGCSFHNHCKFCGKEIMQDSQGNWFLGEEEN